MLSRRRLIGCSVCAALAAAPAWAGRTGRGIIDVHAHVQIESYLAFVGEAGLKRPALRGAPVTNKPSPASDDDAALSLRLALMNQAGVRQQVLSPTLAPYLADIGIAVEAARRLNDAHARLVADHPGRLASYVSLPLPHIAESLAEMRRGLDSLGMVGVTMQSECVGLSIADDRFTPLFEEMNSRRAVLFLHPAIVGMRSPLITEWSLTAAAGPLFEDAAVALHLMVKAIPSRFPDIRIIIPHLGGGLAVMLERLDNQLKLSVPGLPEPPSATARRLWYDTVSHGSGVGLRAAVDAFGVDRLLPGSDFPVLLGFETYDQTFDYVRRAGLPRRQADQILQTNASRLFEGRAA
ncbi:MAG: amidohydrolase family protein [Caulobacter sp.]|nr:amidohydrolase family protein [Caulobacter sp.]